MSIITKESIAKNSIKVEWAKLSVLDIKNNLKQRGLSFKLSKLSNRHFVIKGLKSDTSLYATTGVISVNSSGKLTPVPNVTLPPEDAFSQLVFLAKNSN